MSSCSAGGCTFNSAKKKKYKNGVIDIDSDEEPPIVLDDAEGSVLDGPNIR